MPRRLFYRALLIVAAPIIILQLVITIVFFDSLWIKTNKGMTRALVNEIKTFIEVYDDEIYAKDEITNLFSVYQDLNIELIEDNKFDFDNDERWFSPIDRTLRRELKSRFSSSEYWFDTISYKELIDLRIKYQSGYFKFLVPKDRVTSSSARIFALWITVPPIIMVFISLIFLKNQTRPITNLAKVAERFAFQTRRDGESQSTTAKILPKAQFVIAIIDENRFQTGDFKASKPSRSSKNFAKGVVHSLSSAAIVLGRHGNKRKKSRSGWNYSRCFA